jgi:acetyltransferase-like isoleucine patch superfamily enzyme
MPWLKIQCKLRKMRRAGATIGNHIGIGSNIMPPASKNLKIGDHVSIHTDRIDVRAPLTIGDYVILGDSASIITCSHDIDDPEWMFKAYGLEIEDYVWIATRAMILPSCRKIGRGAVIGAGAVVVKDVPPMAVVSGNPAQIIRYRKCLHEKLKPEHLLGGGLADYLKVRFGG